MSPLLFFAKVAGVALLTAAGTALVLEKLCPKPSDLVEGAIHFRKGMNEFQTGGYDHSLRIRDAFGRRDSQAKRGSSNSDRLIKLRETVDLPSAFSSIPGGPFICSGIHATLMVNPGTANAASIIREADSVAL